jgi:hypothetical protein
MKTITKALSILTIAGLATWTVACDKKTQNNQTPPVVYQNCVNCGGVINGAEFFRSQSKDYAQSILLNLNFIGSNTVVQPYYNNSYYGGSAVINYSGPVAAAGTLTINVGSYFGECVLQPGQYSISTLQAGTWANAVVQNLRLQAYGPTNMIISIPIAQVSAKRYDQMGRLWTEIPQEGRIFGNVIIENVNGYRCYRDILVD